MALVMDRELTTLLEVGKAEALLAVMVQFHQVLYSSLQPREARSQQEESQVLEVMDKGDSDTEVQMEEVETAVVEAAGMGAEQDVITVVAGGAQGMPSPLRLV